MVSRRRVWLAGGMYGCGYQEVGVVGTIGVVSGCFPHITYISLLHLYLFFLQQHPYFFFHFVKMIFRSLYIYVDYNSAIYNYIYIYNFMIFSNNFNYCK